MTFVERFFSFNLEIADPGRRLYLKTRVKTPKHPDEPLSHLTARILAFAHCYEEGVSFSRGFFAPEEPAIWKIDPIQGMSLWADVGAPDGRKLERAARREGGARKLIYLFRREQPEDLAHRFQRCRGGCAAKYRTFMIEPDLAEELADGLKSTSDWQLTFIDDLLCLSANGRDWQGSIIPIEPG